MKFSLWGAACACAMFSMPFVADAALVKWELSGGFNDGGTLTGSFVFDADVEMYSSVAITTTAGGLFAGTSYDSSDVTQESKFLLNVVTNFGLPDLTGQNAFGFSFESALTNAGGTVPIDVDFGFFPAESSCNTPSCNSQAVIRVLSSGSVSSVVSVPVPAAVWLFGAGLIGLVSLAKRKKA